MYVHTHSQGSPYTCVQHRMKALSKERGVDTDQVLDDCHVPQTLTQQVNVVTVGGADTCIHATHTHICATVPSYIFESLMSEKASS